MTIVSLFTLALRKLLTDMNQTLIRWALLLFVGSISMNTSSASTLNGDPATFKFSLDNCNAWLPTEDNQDFSEFTGTALNTAEISMSVVGGSLYRINPEENGHSCTTGLNGTNAMCVSAFDDCYYDAGNEQSLRFDILLSPTANQFVRLSELNFQELAPEIFSWNDGFSFTNDYPTRYALRVIKNGIVVFQQVDIQTTQQWSLENFQFTGSDFTVGTPTVFNFELLAYCPVGANAVQHVWDVEDIEITALCLNQSITNGGEITGGPFSYCIDEGPFFLPSIGLFNQTGQNQDWVITNSAGTIIDIPDNPSDVNFASLGGALFLQNLSYQNGLTGLSIGANLSNLNGVFSLSNSISIAGVNPSGGILVGGPFNFCVDGEADFVTDLTISGSIGSSMQWVVTDPTGLILDLPGDIAGVNFDAAGEGDCFIWNVGFETVGGLFIGGDIEELSGCFGVSNGILVEREIVDGGTLEGGPFTFCVDGNEDFISDISLTGVDDDLNITWIITDIQLNILGVPENPEDVDFDEAGSGVCFIWSIAHPGVITGVEVGNNVSQIEGCYGLSNSIQVERIEPLGGTLEGGPFEFCVDGVEDNVSGITLTGNNGEITTWIVTDEDGIIIGFPGTIENVNFDNAGIGSCFIYSVSYLGVLGGLDLDEEIDELDGCFALSNSIEVVRSIPSGGNITGGTYDFCIDGEEDFITDIVLSDNSGTNSSWIVADADGVILGLPENIEDVNFDNAGGGACLIYNINFQDGLSGLELNANINDLNGCFGLSNSIIVNRSNPIGGTLEGGPFEFCLDGEADTVTGVSVSGNSGENTEWLITDEDLEIIAVTNELDTINFDGAGPGICLIWSISYANGIEGLDAENPVGDLDGCFALSDSIVVTRTNVDGGTLEGGPFNFCLDDTADMISDITLENNVGANSTFLITDENGDILELTTEPDTIDFNGAIPGVCFIWNISYEDGIDGLEAGSNVSDLEGCFAISNSISITRSAPEGGTLTSEDFDFMIDGMPDMVSGIVVSDTAATNYSWIVTDLDLEIIGLPENIEDVNFDEGGAGICLIWFIGFEDGLENLELGNNVNDLEGCFDLSTNSVTVNRTASAGGVLEGGPFNFCIDGVADMVSGITVTDTMGTNFQWIVTTDADSIIGLPDDIEMVDFDPAGAGQCYIYLLSFESNTTGVALGNFISDIQGGFALSNNLVVNRTQPEGGTLTSDDFNFTIDGTPDMVSGIVVSDTAATNYAWIVTDADLNIIGLPADIEDVNFDDAEIGVCLIWYIGFEDGLENLELDNNVSDLEGCFDLSNSVAVNRTGEAEVLEGGPFNFCIDGVADMVSGITVTDTMGTNFQWIITTDTDSIIGLPDDIEMVDFDAAGLGQCYIYFLAFEDNTDGIALNNFISDIEGNFVLSNNLIVNRTQPEGGIITGGPYSFCIDGEDDFITDLVLTGNVGSNTQWIVTDEDENIITVTDSIQLVNFDNTIPGTCLIFSITYEDEINGLINDSPLSILDGCFSLSNSIEVVKSEISGGSLEGGPFNFCIDMEMDTVSNIVLSGASGDNNSWVITDEEGLIIGLPDTITTVDFNASGNGVCLIWNLSFQDGLTGLEVDNNVSDLEGCFDLSNSITVTRSEPVAGVIEGGPFNFTIDGIEDNVSGITLSGNVAPNAMWVVTSLSGNISAITDDIESINFDTQGAGECLIWHIGFLDGIMEFIEGNNLDDIEGCFAISNSISVMKMPSTGGTLFGGPFNFCIDDESDFVSGLEVMDNMGSIEGWIVTDEDGTILGLPNTIETVDFNENGVGLCYIYYISYEPGLTGLAEGNNISAITGTFGLSNFVEVNRTIPVAGNLTGGPFEFCLDGTPDMITDVTLTGNDGANTSWVITDDAGVIVGLPDTLASVNFEDAGPGICLIYSITFNDGLEGLEVDSLLTNLEGCFDLTDNIMVTRTEINGGVLTGGPFNFCIDGSPDNVSGISITDFVGPNITWVVTDEDGVITAIVESLGEVDFDDSGSGTCFIYNLAFETGLTGLEVDNNINMLDGCFAFSEAITVNKTTPLGGTVTGTPIEFCIDANDDFVTDFAVTGESGSNSSWLVLNASGDILGVPEDISTFNFNNLGAGTCFVWHISFEDGLDGLFVGENVMDLDGCFDISNNNVAVTKIEPLGGSLSPISYSFCVDGMPDLLTGLELVDTVGVNFAWVITDLAGEILDLPASIDTVDFDNSAIGTCLVYNITFEDGLTGLTVGELIDDIDGCFDFSNSVQVIKEDCILMSNDSIVINEIFPENNQVELKNLSDVAIDVSGYWLCQFPAYGQMTNLALEDCGLSFDYILDPGEILVVETNASLNSNDGELGLYNSDLTNNNFGNSDFIVDYVEWGSSGHMRSSTAVAAGIWTAGDFVPSFSINNSIEYDGLGNSPFDWTEDNVTLCNENTFTNPNPEIVETTYSLYPNPSKDEINLNFTKSPAAKATARIFSTFGKVVMVKEINLEFNQEPVLNISNLQDGTYILEVSAEGFLQTQRFIKLN